MQFKSRPLLGLLTVLLIGLGAGVARGEEFDLPQGSLLQALTALQQQSRIQLLYRISDVEGRSTPGVRGNFTAEEALRRLIERTDLVMRQDSSGAFALEVAPRAAPQTGPATQSPHRVELALPTPVRLEEVEITAQRRSENLQDVPITVDSATGPQLAAMGVVMTYDLGAVTPGLNYTVAAGYAAPFLRGIGSNNVGPGTESPVATYVDGVYISTPTASVFSLNGIAQIDVLKGPQGTLFGRNATAGVIQITTRDPTASERGSASVGYGSYRTSAGNLYLNEPLREDVFVNLSGGWQKQDAGFGRNLTTGDSTNSTASGSLRSKLKWVASPDTSVLVALDWASLLSSEGIAWRPAQGARTVLGDFFPGGQQDIYSNLNPQVHDIQNGVSLKVDHNSGATRWMSLTAYRQEKVYQVADLDYGLPVNISAVTGPTRTTQFSQELQWLSRDGAPIEWVLGTYEFYSSGRYDPVTFSGTAFAPLSDLLVNTDQKALSAALFAQGTTPVAPATNLTVGLRYTVEERRINSSRLGRIDGREISADISAADETFTAPTWRLAVDQRLAPDVMAYLSYNRGFKSGVYSAASQTPTTVVKPETVDTMELGAKSETLNHRLRLNTTLFYNIYRDMQVPAYGVQGNGFIVLRNAARARTYGLDVDLEFADPHGFRITSGLELLHAMYVSFPGATFSTPLPLGGNLLENGNAAGRQVMLTSKATAHVSCDWRVPVKFATVIANLTYSYNSGWYTDPDNRVRQPAFNQLNAQATWDILADELALVVWGHNLSNEVFAQWMSDTTATTTVYSASAPRTFGASISWKF